MFFAMVGVVSFFTQMLQVESSMKDYLSKYLQHLHTLHPDEVEEMINKEVCLLAFVSRVMPFPSPASCSPEGYGESAFTPCWDKRLAGLMITGTALEL